jgi:tetratricopeptide (TPR) repeat protein
LAQDYLSKSPEDRRALGSEAIYRDLDVLLAICGQLRDLANTNPTDVLSEASSIYSWVNEQAQPLGLFDERDFFLGESALLAGNACRMLGDRSATDLWLDRADASYRHTINPAASLARVAYARMTLRYDTGRFSDVLELLPSVAITFQKLRMNAELAKCRYLEASCLKEMGRFDESVQRFEALMASSEFEAEPALRGMSMMSVGNMRSAEGDQQRALDAYRAAQPLLEAGKRYSVLASLKGMVAETLQRLGQVAAAVDAYRESVSDYVRLGMQTRAAYLRVVLSEALLEAGRPREAEWELLAALPTINEQEMVPEGFAAVVLLQESLRQRRTDPKALADLRSHLQANY